MRALLLALASMSSSLKRAASSLASKMRISSEESDLGEGGDDATCSMVSGPVTPESMRMGGTAASTDFSDVLELITCGDEATVIALLELELTVWGLLNSILVCLRLITCWLCLRTGSFCIAAIALLISSASL